MNSNPEACGCLRSVAAARWPPQACAAAESCAAAYGRWRLGLGARSAQHADAAGQSPWRAPPTPALAAPGARLVPSLHQPAHVHVQARDRHGRAHGAHLVVVVGKDVARGGRRLGVRAKEAELVADLPRAGPARVRVCTHEPPQLPVASSDDDGGPGRLARRWRAAACPPSPGRTQRHSRARARRPRSRLRRHRTGGRAQGGGTEWTRSHSACAVRCHGRAGSWRRRASMMSSTPGCRRCSSFTCARAGPSLLRPCKARLGRRARHWHAVAP
jgi:hypothetical protein